ncbi:hypothetical protein HZA97_09655 [Candidatus Woesearchaeota archaeon]|nr:hypothetical protein [Candidatus Woesearchaeota archaeon]
MNEDIFDQLDEFKIKRAILSGEVDEAIDLIQQRQKKRLAQEMFEKEFEKPKIQ